MKQAADLSIEPNVWHNEPEWHMKIIRTLFAVVVLSCSAQLVHSADTEGHFWLGGGAGSVKCHVLAITQVRVDTRMQ